MKSKVYKLPTTMSVEVNYFNDTDVTTLAFGGRLGCVATRDFLKESVIFVISWCKIRYLTRLSISGNIFCAWVTYPK